jgi:histidyl-tRNA synthetase
VGLEAGPLLAQLHARDFVGLEAELDRQGAGSDTRDLLLDVPQRRGGADVLDGLAVADGLRTVFAGLDESVAARVVFDLGLARGLGYYTGAVFDVLDPALGTPLGGGGRYDDLLGRFGRSLPAVGFAIGVDRLHIALTGEERGLG